jgi:hypothetical protein
MSYTIPLTRQRIHAQFLAATEKVQHYRRDGRNLEKVPELFEEDYSSMSDDEGGANGHLNGIPHLYHDKTWNKGSFEYDPP